jgi:hypothetical protein
MLGKVYQAEISLESGAFKVRHRVRSPALKKKPKTKERKLKVIIMFFP